MGKGGWRKGRKQKRRGETGEGFLPRLKQILGHWPCCGVHKCSSTTEAVISQSKQISNFSFMHCS